MENPKNVHFGGMMGIPHVSDKRTPFYHVLAKDMIFFSV
jgi:hypothetical protein